MYSFYSPFQYIIGHGPLYKHTKNGIMCQSKLEYLCFRETSVSDDSCLATTLITFHKSGKKSLLSAPGHISQAHADVSHGDRLVWQKKTVGLVDEIGDLQYPHFVANC